MNSTKKAIKICCDGETKRLKISGDYAELIHRAKESFQTKKAVADKDFKFFYLDNEDEVISITSQADLNEALGIEDLSSIKLTVASNMQEAIKILHTQMMESQSIAESINQSQVSSARGGRRSRANSEFD